MEKLLSASDIALLDLPGIPRSKAAILAMAKREGWYCEERKGLGGTKLVFELPTALMRGGVSPGARYSAGEIAAMRLPDLPSSRGEIVHLAQQEQWTAIEIPGIAGNRTLYTIPEKYLPPGFILPQGSAPAVRRIQPPLYEENTTSTPIAAGTRANPELLALAVQAVEEWCQETGRTLSPGRKGSVVAVLYDYLAKGGGEAEVKTLLQAVG